MPFPLLHKSLAHPCALDGSSCCGLPQANFVLRFESFLRAPQALLILAYEAWPICGDGLDLTLRLTHAGALGVKHLSLGARRLASCILMPA